MTTMPTFGEFEGVKGEHGRSFSSVTQLMGFLYLQDNHPTHEAAVLAWQAAKLLLSSRLIKELPGCLGNAAARTIASEEFADDLHEFRKFIRRYDWTVEDLIITGAFERYAKSELLRNGYLIHTIKKSSSLRGRQSSCPVSMAEFQVERVTNSSCTIGKNTIGVSTLLEPAYAMHLGLSSETLKEVQKLADSRNQVHFTMIDSRSSTNEASIYRLLGLRELSDAILNNPALAVLPPVQPFAYAG